MSKVTEWYPASVKPVRDGEYETRSDECAPIIKRKFEDNSWWFFEKKIGRWLPSFFDILRLSQWRGLAEKPE